MKKTILLCTYLLASISGQAQGIDGVDPLNDINAIKRDTSYIYAEATMKDAVEAKSGARAVLELKIYDWLRNCYPGKNADSLVNQSKNHWCDLLTSRGNYNRVLAFVSKQVIVPVQKSEDKAVEDPYSQQDKIAFIKRMYKDFFDNRDFDTEKLSNLRKYLTSELAEQIHFECPFEGCDESDSSYIVDLFIDGSFTYERPDPGYRVVTRSIKPLKYDWFEIKNIWDGSEDPVIIGLKVQNTEEGLRVVDFSCCDDKKTEGLSEIDNTIEDWELQISSEEQKMLSLVSFYEIEPYIKQLKADNRIREYGKYSTMPKNDVCHLFIYNKEGEIVTVMKKTMHDTYNLKTREKDVISNYKNCGAIWFLLNGR